MDDAKKRKTYKIGQAARMLGLKTHVLRFWETEFPQIAPIRTSTDQRLYTEEHLRTLSTIRRLLYDEGLTIEGARKRLEETTQHSGLLQDLRQELLEIRKLLL